MQEIKSKLKNNKVAIMRTNTKTTRYEVTVAINDVAMRNEVIQRNNIVIWRCVVTIMLQKFAIVTEEDTKLAAARKQHHNNKP